MRINGEWALCDDDAVRPILRGELQTADGRWVQAPLLVDTGADCTVLSADVFDALKLPAAEVPKFKVNSAVLAALRNPSSSIRSFRYFAMMGGQPSLKATLPPLLRLAPPT
jgi:hypothetical protein